MLPGTKSCPKKSLISLKKKERENNCFWLLCKRRRKAESDLDVLVEFSSVKGLLTLFRLEREL
jgi:predicted nucleotidyltransferase